MPTLKKLFRDALASRGPTPDEAQADLDRILERAERGPRLARPPARRTAPALLLFAAALVAAALAVGRWRSTGDKPLPPFAGGAPSREARPSAAAPADRSIRIYVRKADEPEAQALSLTLSTQGDL